MSVFKSKSKCQSEFNACSKIVRLSGERFSSLFYFHQHYKCLILWSLQFSIQKISFDFVSPQNCNFTEIRKEIKIAKYPWVLIQSVQIDKNNTQDTLRCFSRTPSYDCSLSLSSFSLHSFVLLHLCFRSYTLFGVVYGRHSIFNVCIVIAQCK